MKSFVLDSPIISETWSTGLFEVKAISWGLTDVDFVLIKLLVVEGTGSYFMGK